MSQGDAEKPEVPNSASASSKPPSGAPPRPPSKAATPKPGSQPIRAVKPGSGTKPTTKKQGSSPQLKVGNYRIIERVGSGGMGTVYRAMHVELDREVALKVLPPEMNSNPTMVARFKREAKAAAQLHHENIVQIYDVSEDKGRHFLALEFVRGKDLSDLIAQKRKLDVKQAVDILKQATRALEHAFQKGIVHRDIKPSNFLITNDGKVKLCDLGLALQTDSDEQAKVTRDGTTVGTVDYMSPEQARDSRLADTRSDIYSLGCTFYQMLTGRVPFEEGSIPEKLFKHSQDPVPDPLQFNADISSQVLYVLSRMLEKKPEDRYQTPAELLQDLNSLELTEESAADATRKTLAIGAEADEAATEELVLRRSPQQAKGLSSQFQWLMIGGGAAAVLLIGFVVWLATRGSDAADNSGSNPVASTTSNSTTVPVVPSSSSVVPAPATGTPAAVTTVRPPASPAAGKTEPTGDTQPAADIAKPSTLKNEQTPQNDSTSVRAPTISAEERRKLEQEIFPPWPVVQIKSEPVTLARGAQQESGGVFSRLEFACQSARSGSSKIVQIEDNGPIFERSFSVPKSQLEIRPKANERLQYVYRPVVAYDALADKSNPKPYFFEAKNTDLYIEGVDFVLNAEDLRETIGLKPFAFFDVQGGDLVFKNCSFTVLGKHGETISLIKFHGLRDADPAREPAQVARLTIENCLIRGDSLTAVQLASSVADVKVLDSLLVTGAGPLFDLKPPAAPDVVSRPKRTLRFIRSTFSTRGDFMAFDGSSNGTIPTDLKLLDSVIACSAPGGSHKLIKSRFWPDTNGGLDKTSIDERSVLYAGWDTLLHSGVGGKLAVKTLDEWKNAWQPGSFDGHLRAESWPTEAIEEVHAVAASAFVPNEVAAGIASRLGEPSIGCAVNRLPNVPAEIAVRTFKKSEAPELIALQQILPSFTLDSQKNPLLSNWQGEQNRRRNHLNQNLKLAPGDELDPVLELTFNVNSGDDLGKFILSQQLLDTNIVVISGSGPCRMTPVRMPENKSLVLWFQRTPQQPPIIVVPVASSQQADALIDVQDADLIIEGAHFAWSAGSEAGPRRFFRVTRGNLTVSRCRLNGPLVGDTGFQAIAFTGGPQQSKPPATIPAIAPAAFNQATGPLHLDFHPAPHSRVNVCQIIDSFIAAESRAISVAGSQAILRLTNCVAVTPGTIATIDDLDRFAQDFENVVILEQNTLAASRSFFEVGEWLAPALPSRPLLFSTQDNLFCDPFDVGSGAASRSRSSVLLRYGGRTLQQGILHWESTHDAFAFDLHSYVLPKDASTGARQKFEQDWISVWGRPHVTEPIVDSNRIEKIRLNARPNASTGVKIKDFDRDKKLADLTVQDQCEAYKRASHGGPVGAEINRVGL